MARRSQQTIGIVSDHAGWRLKRELIPQLRALKLDVRDVGDQALVPGDDYPKVIQQLVRWMGHSATRRGVAICRSGIGMTVAANKYAGIRAAQVSDTWTAVQARRDEDANVITLAAARVGVRAATRLTTAWLHARPSSAPRHQRRRRQLRSLDRGRATP